MRQELQLFDFNIICSTMSVGLVGGGGCDTGRFRFRFFFCVGFDIIIAIVLWSVILSIFLVHYVKYYHR